MRHLYPSQTIPASLAGLAGLSDRWIYADGSPSNPHKIDPDVDPETRSTAKYWTYRVVSMTSLTLMGSAIVVINDGLFGGFEARIALSGINPKDAKYLILGLRIEGTKYDAKWVQQNVEPLLEKVAAEIEALNAAASLVSRVMRDVSETALANAKALEQAA